jgi:hypothetical protein
VLPLPVKKDSQENAVRFIDLKGYPSLFDDLDSGFPPPPTKDEGTGPRPAPAQAASMPLPVVQVGDFAASFVPTVKDFNRLDARFQLPAELFTKIPDYQHYGFAVFKLKPGVQTVHPMAFEFPTALPDQLFFPTVHIHDGKVHARATFDHVLYCQPGGPAALKLSKWAESPKLASHFVHTIKTAGLVLPNEHCYKRELRGLLPNQDTFVAST